MKTTFVGESSGQPLSKHYEKDGSGQIKKSNYFQHYKDFTSVEEHPTTIEEFHKALVKHASKGHAIVKGNYIHPLVDEPRKGLADKAQPTQWLCLDFDGLDHVTNTDTLLAPLGMSDVSHIVQYSAGHGLTKEFRAHVFLMLNVPIGEVLLKQWFLWLNLTNPVLKASLSLTSSGNAVKWPLDVSLAETHRLIYIAPPSFVNMKDPFSAGGDCGQLDRITLVERAKPVYDITAALATAELSTVNTLKATARDELRAKAGLRKKQERLKYHTKLNAYVSSNPDSGTVTGYREERGFAYLNLNGGDSWGYFHPLNNFELILNFKGEPSYLTKELLPDYYTECVASRKDRAATKSDLTNDSTDVKYFYFTEKQSGAYFVGTWHPESDTRVLDPIRQRQQINDFCIEHGLDEPTFIPSMETIFDPSSDVFYNPAERTINLYKPSPYKLAAKAASAPQKMPSTIERLLRHVLGNDKVSYGHFINWLAFIWQYGKKPKTAWVIHGTTGTGKGVLMQDVLQPLFGEEQAMEITIQPLSENFNGYLRNTQILAVDEADTDGMPNVKLIAAKLKNWITQDRITIREMRVTSYSALSYLALIFFSNRSNPTLVDWEDRRFNIAPRQEVQLPEIFTKDDFAAIPKELMDFAHWLQAFDVDVDRAMSPLENDAKAAIQEVTSSSPDDIVRALKAGNFRYFVDLLPSGIGDNALSPGAQVSAYNFKEVLDHVYQGLLGRDGPVPLALAREDLSTIFNYTLDWKLQPAKFTKAVGKFGLRITPVRVRGKSVRGYGTVWNATPEDLQVYRDLITPAEQRDVTPLRPNRKREAS